MDWDKLEELAEIEVALKALRLDGVDPRSQEYERIVDRRWALHRRRAAIWRELDEEGVVVSVKL